jgi:hypothetical protein
MNRLIQTLFHPFLTIAGALSLVLGLLAILLAGWIGFHQGLHFDGVLDAHVGGRVPLWMSLAEGVIDWLTLALPLLFVGRILSKTAFRAIDLIGTQALARWPTLIVSLLCLAPGFHRFTAALIKSMQSMTANPAKIVWPPLGMDAFVFGIVTVLMLACTVWMVALMWKSFSHCCNVRGGRAVSAFVLCLVGAEGASKVLLSLLFRQLHR